MNENHEHEELKRLAPTLHRLKGRDPFVVPDGFFERLPHAIQASLVEQEASASTWGIWSRRAVWALPVCAALVVAVFWAMPKETEVDGPALAESQHVVWDEFDASEIPATWYADAPGLGATTLELNDSEWLAYWEEQGSLDLYLELE